ncbi:hypothetical protein DPMN_119746 [Dreissena polymorpha]|uniref:Uncharacterized protein n=1 Tax=Dreissena polymorpha TaxID=45954 RepID=A0A9D4JN16_DREPO|nr:hypothetical protein DPMN_119746 [Dreissena polymorpha]
MDVTICSPRRPGSSSQQQASLVGGHHTGKVGFPPGTPASPKQHNTTPQSTHLCIASRKKALANSVDPCGV